MGSYDITCSLSKASIGYGKKVKLAFLSKQPEPFTRVYHDSALTNISFIIDGEYNDYGCVSVNEDDFEVKRFMEMFNHLLEKGNVIIKEDDCYKYENTFDSLMRVVERNLVSIYYNEHYYGTITYMVFHEKIFNDLIVNEEVYNKSKALFDNIDEFYEIITTFKGEKVYFYSDKETGRYFKPNPFWFNKSKDLDFIENDENGYKLINSYCMLDCLNYFYFNSGMFYEEWNYANQTDNHNEVYEYHKKCLNFIEELIEENEYI